MLPRNPAPASLADPTWSPACWAESRSWTTRVPKILRTAPWGEPCSRSGEGESDRGETIRSQPTLCRQTAGWSSRDWRTKWVWLPAGPTSLNGWTRRRRHLGRRYRPLLEHLHPLPDG